MTLVEPFFWKKVDTLGIAKMEVLFVLEISRVISFPSTLWYSIQLRDFVTYSILHCTVRNCTKRGLPVLCLLLVWPQTWIEIDIKIIFNVTNIYCFNVLGSKKKYTKNGPYCCVTYCHERRGDTREGKTKLGFSKVKRVDKERTKLWTIAINRKNNKDGSLWQPTKNTIICGKHFIKGKPSNDSGSPDYVPSIFPKPKRSSLATKPKTEDDLKRYERLQNRELPVSTDQVVICFTFLPLCSFLSKQTCRPLISILSKIRLIDFLLKKQLSNCNCNIWKFTGYEF